ncbi:methyl-CpG-binding domain-containing protein 13-like isoform X1 [Cucurbita pepo subsp. pepo]|uniref:methyl-CpG-binding domain-containing protein 13-like isoform X1 n=1 Tax=Cucurbita pepo subsp. pepo TaxID=3664 RepID=UPI000C9D3078|nr:methyl-CpG-binding domain-containing protein 13-like isoform X1 [Cucurbita pepo subsp. pepo]XP_023532850.1 methyl-CpG-binding domain-containing protein 13-like isoform X1 [Cucurbita pepo subsp. pepo]XP_023532852.1 methyl-CpG-binding domain-containing protein 13-like isoform X1 [Cucurbita pepo subsp. pepo]XP_023532853.1 methyl-CpG-binding domain-containing protein 13-like isoform X1 [Cucurbita pepo subsp. pepo]
MVSKGSPDWLPSGWTVQFKVQKTGRKIRFYTNLESGKSFYSKDDVIGYIKSVQSQKSSPTSSRIKTQSGNSPVQLTVKANERPEWLPAGWKVESRTRMSGSNVGGVYKCYIDPVTGNRFYSKPEVFRYLRTVKNKVCTLKERKTSNGKKSRTHVVIEHYKDEDLPPGWIKEIKIREKADGIRKDPFYIDPKSGYVFRSKKDVLRYLETGEISRHAFKPKEGVDNDQESINHKIISSPSTAKGQKPEHPTATPQPLADVVGKEMPTESSSEFPGDQILLPSGRYGNLSSELNASVSRVGTVTKIVSSLVREPSEIKEKSRRSSASPEPDLPDGKETERASDDVPVSTSASELEQEKALPKAEKQESNKVDPENTPLSTTASKLQQEKTAICDVMEMGDNGEKIETERDDNGENTETEGGDNGEHTETKRVDSRKKTKTRRFKKKKDISLPRRSSKRLAGRKPESARKVEAKEVPQASNRNCLTKVSPDADKACQQHNVGPERVNEDHGSKFKDIPLHENPSNKRKTPPECGLDVPQEKIQRIRTEKKDDVQIEAQLSVPIAEFWSDPCLEFAIKTLTGALPVENATTTDGLVSDPTIDFLQGQKSVKNGSGSCMDKRTQENTKFKNKKEFTSNRQSSSTNGLKPELASNIISFQQANDRSNEAVLAFNLSDSGILGEPQNEPCKTSCQKFPPRELHHPPPDRINTCHESNKMALDDLNQKHQTKDTTSETPIAFPFGDSWADPCLDFAFKTLTGAIPIEGSLEIQSYFEERIESSRSQRESSIALPDYGSPNFFQNDISSHFDGPEKSGSVQHLSLDPLLGNVNLPSCSGFTSQQQPRVDRNRPFKGR